MLIFPTCLFLQIHCYCTVFLRLFLHAIFVLVERNIKATSAERSITFEVLKADFEPIHTLSKCTPTKNVLTDLSLDQQRGERFIIPKNILEHFTSFMFRHRLFQKQVIRDRDQNADNQNEFLYQNFRVYEYF